MTVEDQYKYFHKTLRCRSPLLIRPAWFFATCLSAAVVVVFVVFLAVVSRQIKLNINTLSKIFVEM